jgi:DNA-binding CsgD family transcriptional regulator
VSPPEIPWQNGAMAQPTAPEILAELRRYAAPRRRHARHTNPVELLARLLDECEALGVEERPGGVVFRLQTRGQDPARLTCVLHHASPAPLTAAEAEVAERMCEGRTLPQIARLRGVSVNTIKSQVRQIFRKLEVDSRVALVRRLAP